MFNRMDRASITIICIKGLDIKLVGSCAVDPSSVRRDLFAPYKVDLIFCDFQLPILKHI